jgi:uncharacterized protein (TIGR02588 family)
MKRNTDYQTRSRRRFSAEQITFTISCIIVSLLIGLVLLVWATEGDDPPLISVSSSMSEIREAPGQFYVPFSVTNTGGGTAEAVHVIGELRVNGQVAESGEQEIDFLSSGEVAEGAFIFSRDPQTNQLTIRVSSYKLP